MTAKSPEITAIPAFSDNYIWLITSGSSDCAVVDPGDARPVEAVLQRNGLTLRHILLTHHHADHTGGVAALLRHYDARVLGPADPRMPAGTIVLGEGERVELPELGLQFDVLEVPGHTSSHIAYHGHGALFCGDTLFSVGCGRLFEGTPVQMQSSLDKFAALPGDMRVYCAHEYTQSNCAFALAVEPGNAELQQRAARVAELRAAGRMTVPSTLAEERAVNPFMRSRESEVVAAARVHAPGARPGEEVLGVIRDWKDRF